MASESGCVTVSAQQAADKEVRVTPAVQPMAAVSSRRRLFNVMGKWAVNEKPRVATIEGVEVVVALDGDRAGDQVCWTSYS